MATKQRKPKPLKSTYKELLQSYLTSEIYVDQNYLLRTIVNMKYRTTRHKKSKELTVLSNLKSGMADGEFRSLIENGKTYWRSGDGVPIRQEPVGVTAQDNRYFALAELQRINKLVSDIVYAGLYQEYGNDWQNHIAWSIKTSLLKHTSKTSGNPWAPSKSGDILEEASMAQLATIISNNWTIFKNKLHHRYMLMGKLDELNDYRNSLAHNKLLDEWQLQYILLSCKVLERVIKMTEEPPA